MTEFIITTKEDLASIVDKSIKDAFAENNPKPPPTQKKLYTKIEAKNRLRVSMPTIDRWSKKGILKRIEVESRVFFSSESVEALLEE